MIKWETVAPVPQYVLAIDPEMNQNQESMKLVMFKKNAYENIGNLLQVLRHPLDTVWHVPQATK